MSNQILYPNPQSTKNTNVQVSELVKDSLSKTLDLQSLKVIRGYFTPTAIGDYFIYDVRTNLPIQLQQGDAILRATVYGPNATIGAPSGVGFDVTLFSAPTFNSDGVAVTPGSEGSKIVRDTQTTLANVNAGLVIVPALSTVVDDTYQWVIGQASVVYTTASTISVTLLVVNANLQEVY